MTNVKVLERGKPQQAIDYKAIDQIRKEMTPAERRVVELDQTATNYRQEFKQGIKKVKESKAVNYATLGLTGLAAFYEATQFGGDPFNTGAICVIGGSELNRLVRRYKVKV